MCSHIFLQKSTAQISCWQGFVCSILQTAIGLQIKTTNNLVCLFVSVGYKQPLATFNLHSCGILYVYPVRNCEGCKIVHYNTWSGTVRVFAHVSLGETVPAWLPSVSEMEPCFNFFQAWEGGPLGIGWKVISHSRDFFVFMLKLDWVWQTIKPYSCSWSNARFALSCRESPHFAAWRVLNSICPLLLPLNPRLISINTGTELAERAMHDGCLIIA